MVDVFDASLGSAAYEVSGFGPQRSSLEPVLDERHQIVTWPGRTPETEDED